MRAFIEYPEAGEGRIEVTSEFVVETPGIRLKRLLDEAGEQIVTNRRVRAYWDERMDREDD